MMRVSMWVAVGLLIVSFYCEGQVLRTESRGGQYYADVQYAGAAQKNPDLSGWKASVHSKDGSVAYTLSFEVPYDVPFPDLHLADGGESVLLHASDGLVQFIDNRGNPVAQLHPFEKSEPQLERIVKCSVAHGHVALLVSTPAEEGARLFMTDLNGHEKWIFAMPENTAAEVFLSDDGSLVLAGCYTSKRLVSRSTVIVDQRGILLRTLSTYFRYAAISVDNSLFAVTERNSVLFGAVRGSAVPTRWTTSRRGEIVTDVRFVRTTIAVAVADVEIIDGTPIYQSPQLLVLDRTGEELARWGSESSSEYRGVLQVDQDNLYLESGPSRIVAPLQRVSPR